MTLRQTLARIERQYGPKIARAFAASINDLRDDVIISRVIAALEVGNIEAAVAAMNIDTTAFAKLRETITEAYTLSGGAAIEAGLVLAPREIRAVVRWDVTNPVAERSLREWLGKSITQITEDTRQAARVAMSEGFARGQGPRQIALDVVGRIGPNGRRVGGVLGLTGPQEQYVSNMRRYLREGDLHRVLNMSRRDRRYDRTILRMIENGETPTAAQIEKWTARYSDRLLKLRGDTIARTETAAAVEQARFDAFAMEVDAHNVPDRYVIKEWRHGGGGMRPRDQHVDMNSVQVTGLHTPFEMPDGTLMQGPHDPNAPAHHVINCTCSLLTSVDWVQARIDGVL